MDIQRKQEMLELAKYAFNKPVTGGDSAFFALLDFAKPYLHYEDDLLTSMMIDIPFNVYWREQQLKMSGIGYVATYPEYRGKGAIRELMTKLLRDEYQAGTALSYLAPFSYQFYEKFGYAYTFDQKNYEIAMRDFPKGRLTPGQIKRSHLTELSKTGLYQKAYNQGSLVRETHLWDYYFHDKSKPYFVIYTEREVPLGYLIYEFNGPTFVIRECITQNENAKQAIYHFISNHASTFEKVNWTATINEHFENDLLEPSRAKITLQPYMMARIVNLQEFLNVNGAPSFAAEIIDQLLPENNQIIGVGQPEKMTIGQFTARVFREKQAILRDYF